jgi:Fe-S-cluster containining protein
MEDEFDINPDVLERNVCGCKVCQVHCAVMPSFLLPEDMIPYMIATGFLPEGEEVEVTIEQVMPWARDNLLASDGTYVRVPDSDQVVKIPTLVPASRKNGSCVHFNQKSRLCGIHYSAPFGCRMFSCSMDEQLAKGLSSFAAARLANMWDTLHGDVDELSVPEGLYSAIWLQLEQDGHKRKRTTMALRKKVEKAIAKIRKEEE